MSNDLQKAVHEFQRQNYGAAEQACARALRQDAGNVDAHHLMGVLKSLRGNVQQAVFHLKKTLSLSPQHIQARYNLGKGYRDLGQHQDALKCFETVLQHWTSRADVWVEFAVSLGKAGQVENAIQAYQEAIKLGDSRPEILVQLAHCHTQVYNLNAAESILEGVLESHPNFTAAKVNLAVLRENQGRLNESLQIYDSFQPGDSHYKEATYRRALALLTLGRLEEGCDAYAKRHALDLTTTSYGQCDAPYWSGENLQDKSLLVWTEQGPGDEILLGSMLNAPELRVAKVTIACSKRIAPLFLRSFPAYRVVIRDQERIPLEDVGRFDVQASLTEIAAQVRPSLDHFPTPKSYLVIDEAKRDELRKSYTENKHTRPLIGISWRSSNLAASSQKSSNLMDWVPFFKSREACFVNLQYGETTTERDSLFANTGIELLHDTSIDPLADLDAFTHQVSAMDLVVSTSNTTVHAAGATGTECWTLTPKGTGQPWYWFLEQTKSVWYPSMRLYRQTRAGDWTAPLSAIQDDIKKWSQP